MNYRKKNSKKNKNKQNLPQPARFHPKVLLIWFLIFGAIIALSSMFPSVPANSGQKQLTMQEVIVQAKSGNIAKAIVKADPSRGPEWYTIKGELSTVNEGEKSAFSVEGRLTESRFNELMDSVGGVNIVQKPASTMLTDILINLLPILLIFGLLYFLFVRQLRAAGKGAMSFGRSKAKMLNRDDKVCTFKDVAGCDEAKEEVQEIVEFLSNPEKFQKIGGKVPKGVLMVGPPGTGKTLLARAVAGEAEVPFFTISGSDFVEMFVGVGASRVRDMFEQAKKNSPCIIFIDEIDAVGRQRGAGLGGGNDEREQTLNSLLVEMDGFDAHEGIIVIAATNRPDVLDSALLRPGRFDRQVVIDLPDLHGREAILNVHAKKIKLSKKVDLSIAARNTPGFSGADLENLLNESALMAARHNKKAVSMSDLDDARDKILYGRERRRLMDDEDKKITAVHEAGHALVQVLIDDGYLPVHKVTIIPRGQSLGSTMFAPKKDILNQSKRRLLNQICCAMGGRIAEEEVLKEITSGASGDIRMATKMARHMVCDWGMADLGFVAYGENKEHIFLGKEISRDQNYSEHTAQEIDKEIKGIIETQYKRAKELIVDHRQALDTITAALIEHETIDGIHVKEIIEHGSIQSDVVVSKVLVDKDKNSTSKRETKKVESDEEAEGEVSFNTTA